jgi:dienelactone hydrolase
MRLDVRVPAADGVSPGTLHVPDGAGPWPGVLVFPDAGGVRETMAQMGDRLAGLGYVALIPDIYYRAGEWAPFDVATTRPTTRPRVPGTGTRSATSTAPASRPEPGWAIAVRCNHAHAERLAAGTVVATRQPSGLVILRPWQCRGRDCQCTGAL